MLVLLATLVLPFSLATPVPVAASTLAAAALFNPLRTRRFEWARYNAEAIVAAFTARLRGTVDLDTVQGDSSARSSQVFRARSRLRVGQRRPQASARRVTACASPARFQLTGGRVGVGLEVAAPPARWRARRRRRAGGRPGPGGAEQVGDFGRLDERHAAEGRSSRRTRSMAPSGREPRVERPGTTGHRYHRPSRRRSSLFQGRRAMVSSSIARLARSSSEPRPRVVADALGEVGGGAEVGRRDRRLNQTNPRAWIGSIDSPSCG